MPPCRSECRGGALAPNDRDNIRAPRLASASRWPLRRQSAISSFSRSRRISRVDVQLHADLSARGANLAAHRLKLRSRLRDIRSSTAPLGGRRDTQRSACDAPRKAASWYAADTYGNIRLASPEGSVHAENHGNSTNNQAMRARTRAPGVRLMSTLALRCERITSQ